MSWNKTKTSQEIVDIAIILQVMHVILTQLVFRITAMCVVAVSATNSLLAWRAVVLSIASYAVLVANVAPPPLDMTLGIQMWDRGQVVAQAKVFRLNQNLPLVPATAWPWRQLQKSADNLRPETREKCLVVGNKTTGTKSHN